MFKLIYTLCIDTNGLKIFKIVVDYGLIIFKILKL